MTITYAELIKRTKQVNQEVRKKKWTLDRTPKAKEIERDLKPLEKRI